MIITPTEEQKIWADLEVGVIIHLDLETFEPEYDFRAQWGYHPPASIFNPPMLDTDQWLACAQAAGAKYAVLVAKHCSGFCLWPTDVYDYSVRQSPWKGGKGDVVYDFFASCEKYGIKPGLYYSASVNAYQGVDNPGMVVGKEHDREAQERYNRIVLSQLNELWTRYGKVFEVWFDGGCLPTEQGGPDIASLLHKLQPDAVVYQGPPGTKSLLRWVGNERATAPEDCFSTVDFTPESFDGHDERIYGGNPHGLTWAPAESDTPNRYAKKAMKGGGGWFWREGDEHIIIPAEELFDMYLKSVGRNTNLLIGMVIDDQGRFPEADAKVFAQFGDMVEKAFGAPMAGLDESALQGAPDKYEYTLKLPSGASPRILVLMEDIAYGERVLRYTVNGEITGKCIGHKRIIELPRGAESVVLKIDEAKAEPRLKLIAVYA